MASFFRCLPKLPRTIRLTLLPIIRRLSPEYCVSLGYCRPSCAFGSFERSFRRIRQALSSTARWTQMHLMNFKWWITLTIRIRSASPNVCVPFRNYSDAIWIGFDKKVPLDVQQKWSRECEKCYRILDLEVETWFERTSMKFDFEMMSEWTWWRTTHSWIVSSITNSINCSTVCYVNCLPIASCPFISNSFRFLLANYHNYIVPLQTGELEALQFLERFKVPLNRLVASLLFRACYCQIMPTNHL